MNTSFVMRAHERGYEKFLSTGEASSYIGGRPHAVLERHSSFNFGYYQAARVGFGRIRMFGEETFSGAGCGYDIHPHHTSSSSGRAKELLREASEELRLAANAANAH